jgi:DNA-directed RNA polymerase specialized sigma24 family protein
MSRDGGGGEATRSASDDVIFGNLYRGLRRFAAVVGSLDQDPDDLVQEAVVRALRRAPLHTLKAPDAYLRRSILNLVTDARRSEVRRRRAFALLKRDLETSQNEPLDLSGLDHLAPIDRALLYLVDAEGHDFRYAAELLGLSTSAARSRASRARHRLRGDATDNEETRL